MTDFRLWSGSPTGQTNRGGFTDDLGVQFTITTDGVNAATINGFYFWAPSTGDFDHTKYSWRLYSTTNGTTGSLISNSTTNVAVDFTASAWNYQALAAPLTLTNGTTYVAVLHSTSTNISHYTGTDSYWSSGAGASGIKSGPIFAPGTATALNGAQCSYNEPSASAAFPTSTLGTNYWLDVSISYSGSITDSFTSTSTWTCPSGVSSVDVKCWGGGGSGGGGSVSGAAGGGGAGGSYAASTGLSVTPTTVYTVTIGAGGVHNAGTLVNGATHPGGDSWFNTSGTILAQGGAGGQDRLTSGSGSGGAGSTASCVGTTKNAGGNGAAGVSGTIGGGGGGGAGTTGAGGNASGSTAGTGTSLSGGNGSTGTSAASATAASVYGGGGGGARATTSTVRRGGDGAAGRVEITYTIITDVSASAGIAAATASAGGVSPSLGIPNGKASVTAAAIAPVVAVGIPAGQASVTSAALAPTLTNTSNASAGSAAATAAGSAPTITDSTSVSGGLVTVAASALSPTVAIGVNAGSAAVSATANGPTVDIVSAASPDAGVAEVVVDANECDFGAVEVTPSTAVVRIAAWPPATNGDMDAATDTTATVYDAVGQVEISATTGVAEVVVGTNDAAVDASAEGFGLPDTGNADAAAYLPTIHSTASVVAGKAAAVVSVRQVALGIGVGQPTGALVTALVYQPLALTSGGSSAESRVLRVSLTAERIYAIPHESREIKVKAT